MPNDCSRFLGAAAWLSMMAPVAVHAQQGAASAAVAPPTPAAVGEKQIYTPADFARFAPRTAMDMLNQLPGFTVRSHDQGRGLGQASENVLLNGERVPSKSGGAVAALEKLSADQINRIEIVDGISLGVPGLSGQVANVVTSVQSGGSGQFAWNPEFRPTIGIPALYRGEISYSGSAGAFDYSIGVEEASGRGGSDGEVLITDATGVPVESRNEEIRSREFSPLASARVTWKGPDSIVANTNASFEFDRRKDWETSLRERRNGTNSRRTVQTRRKKWILDAGGDLALPLGGGRLKLIALTAVESIWRQNSAIAVPADRSPATGDRIDSDDLSNEIVGRAEYDWKWADADFQVSGEAAFNRLESIDRRFRLRPENTFVEVPFVGGSGRVQEDRYELTASYRRPLGPARNMQVIAGAEHSTLSTGHLARSFLRPKGSLTFGWQPASGTDVSLKLARIVGQLDFNDFLASADLSQNTENAGNANLVPPQSWELDAEVSRSFGAWGKTRLRVYARHISDIVDAIAIGPSAESLGNIDKATQHGVEWESTVHFDQIGWAGTKLDATLRLRESSVRDPLTGEKRSISNDLQQNIILKLRQDVPGSDWAWGSELSRVWLSAHYRITQYSRSWDTPFYLSAFIEHKDVFGLTVGATLANIADRQKRFERTIYDGRRTDRIRFFEHRKRREGPTLTLQVRGSF